MSRARDNTATLVGLFLFVSLLILGILILQFGKIHRSKIPSYSLYVSFTDATGIIKGSDVRIGGAKVGKVAALPHLSATFDRVLVHMHINEGIGIPRNAEITTSGAGLLGDKYVSIRVPENTDPEKIGFFKEDETLEGISAGSLTSLQVKVEDLSEKAGGAITDLQGAVSRIVAAMDEYEKLAHNANIAIDRFNEGVLSEENIADIRAAMKNLKVTSNNLAESSEKLGPTLDKGSKAMDSIDETLAEIRGIFTDLKPVTEKIKVSVDRIGVAAVSLDKGVKKITTGDGLLPSLINDRNLRNEFHTLVANMRVHGVVFYKDDTKKKEKEAAKARAKAEEAKAPKKKWKLFGG